MGNMSSKNTINDPSYQGLKATDGAAHVRTSGAPGTLETIVFTCKAAGDLMTDPAAPVTTEIFWASGMTTGKTRIRFTFGSSGDATAVPYAMAARVCVNPGDEATARTVLAVPEYQAQAAARTTFGTARTISHEAPVAEYNLDGTDATIGSLAVGFIPPTGTSADEVIVTVEIW